MPDLFDRMTARDVAIAMTSFNRIVMDALVEAGVDRRALQVKFATKAQQLIGQQFEDGAGQLLMLMSDTVKPPRAGA